MILWENSYLIRSLINIEFGELVKSSQYEVLVGEMINQSKVVFPNSYIHQEEQSSGQCDFVDSVTYEKYDAKLPLSPRDGAQIGSNEGNVGNFSKIMYQEAIEFSNYRSNTVRDDSQVTNLKLYGIMKKLIAKTNADEHVIFFIPYPIVLDFTDSPLSGMVDILKAIYRELSKEFDFSEKQIYAVYIAYDKKVVLRNLGKDIREYIEFDKLWSYVDYEVTTLNNL